MTAAITIDVDALRLYHEIHGLEPYAADEDPIFTHALPRFFELLEDFEAPGTVFIVAKDAAPYAEMIERRLADTKSEVASHSYAHDYRMSRQGRTEIFRDLERAHQILCDMSPSGEVHGFRAPGYNTSPDLLQALVEMGYRYDSSLLPSPTYFAARAAYLASYALRRRRSRSLMGRAAAFAGPLEPYRTSPEAPWRAVADGSLLEIPILVDPLTRTHLIGTTWLMLPQPVRFSMLRRALDRLHTINFEMHAIDLLSPDDPGVPQRLIESQPDLRIPLREKLSAFRALLAEIKSRRPIHTLASIAGIFPTETRASAT